MSPVMQFTPTLPPEELARANLYGLVARLFHAAPGEPLVADLLSAEAPAGGEGEHGEELAAAWRDLLDACRTASAAKLELEHTQLFVGTGKAEVTPYLSRYVLRHSSDSPLTALRSQLAEWGIARREDAAEYEDHIAGVCETMRFAIAVQQRTIDEQKTFFQHFVYPGAVGFCDAVKDSANAHFYRPVARFARAFLEIELAAFEMTG